MKKLMICAFAAIMTAYAGAMTADEAIASKNYYVIEKYCASNGMRNVVAFLFKSNTLDNAAYADIFGSITNKKAATIYFPIDYITKSGCSRETYEFAKTRLYSYQKVEEHVMYDLFAKKLVMRWIFNGAEYSWARFILDEEFSDFMKNCTNDIWKTDVCIKFYQRSDDRKYLGMIDYAGLMSKKLYSPALDYAITVNDIDQIIDALLVIPDVTAEQANSIIAPINAVEAGYRKSDIVTALENINSRCTIKLYDDQKTWEPILAKIRAMIQLRK